MHLLDDLLRFLGPHELADERPDDRERRERFERQEERHRQALAHAEQVIADVRRAERLIQEHRW